MKRTQRQLIEEKFHDQYAADQRVGDINVFENFSFAAQENRYAAKTFGQFGGKRILDLGCGFGETAISWAKRGARVDAVDISSASLSLAKKLAGKHKTLDRINFQQMAAENLQFKDNYFDFVFGNGVLHHVNIAQSIRQIHRVLKNGGKAVFVEPLAYNPLINIYRSLARDVRTPTEKPLTFANIKNMRRVFKKVFHREFQLFTLLVFLWFFLVMRINPNEERYWRKIHRLSGPMAIFLKVLITIDNVILKIFPPLRMLCWNTVIILEK